MIVGTGIDLVSISRLREKTKGRPFVEKIFSANEIAYCESTANKEQHYAVRFAAKEAFLKAIGKGLTTSFDLKNIEVINTESERPAILLHEEFATMQIKEGWLSIHVSLSHEGDNAIAIIIIEK